MGRMLVSLPLRIRPERVDTCPKKTAITSENYCFGARRAGVFHFSCIFMPQQRRGGRIHPGSHRTCRGKAPPSCCARPFGRLKSPLGTSLFRCASQTRTCRGEAPPSCCARPFGHLKAPLGLSLLRCARKRELSLDMLGKGQAILPGVFQQELAELLLRNRRFQIILAPLGVGAVEIGGAFLGVGLEADIRRCLHELAQVVAVFHGCFEVPAGALADGELIAVRQQTVQPLQHPQQDAGTFLGQFFDEEGIIHPGRVTVFYRDQDLPAPEAVAVIVSSHKVAIAEADETNVQQALDSLLVFPLDAQTVFSGDDGLDVPCFGQSHHVQVVIDHDQLVLKICAKTGKWYKIKENCAFNLMAVVDFCCGVTYNIIRVRFARYMRRT